MLSRSHFFWSFVAFAVVLFARPTLAQIDTLVTLVDEPTATGGAAIASYGYNPTDNTMFVSSFGSGGELRKISNIDGTPTFETYVTATELQLYYRDGDPDRGVSTPLQASILLNPLPISDGGGIIPAYSIAVINDFARTEVPGDGPVDPAATKRFYQYDLEPVDFMAGEDGRAVFTTLTTLEDMQLEVGTDSTSSNQGRQSAWSGDGQFMYFADSSTDFGGIWKLDPITGDVERLIASSERDTNVEPAVLTSGGVDTIYITGAEGVNEGGIDSFTYDGTTAGPRTTAVSASQIQDFLGLSGNAVADISSMTTDAAGNLYFNNTDRSPERRGIFRLDPQGRLSKVLSYAERDLYFTGDLDSTPRPNSNTLRMQTRMVTHPTAGEVTQIMYTESSGINIVAGAYAFEPGDFDRDGDLDGGDISLFTDALTTRGVEVSDDGDYRFDMNADWAVDGKDVNVLQQFVNIPDGDTNFDGILDFADLDTLSANYHTSGGLGTETWLQGDLTSFVDGYPAEAFDAGSVNFADLSGFADYWLNVLEQPIEEGQLTSRYTGQFLDDALMAFGFESATLLGDYNGDGTVSLADYTVWRDSLGAAGVNLAADGYADGVVDMNDYGLWKAMFGSAVPGTSASQYAVPEPASWALLTGSILGLFRRGGRFSGITSLGN